MLKKKRFWPLTCFTLIVAFDGKGKAEFMVLYQFCFSPTEYLSV